MNVGTSRSTIVAIITPIGIHSIVKNITEITEVRNILAIAACGAPNFSITKNPIMAISTRMIPPINPPPDEIKPSKIWNQFVAVEKNDTS